MIRKKILLQKGNRCLLDDIKQAETVKIHDVDQLSLLLFTAQQLKTPYFNGEQQRFFLSTEGRSQFAGTPFLYFLIEIYGQQLTEDTMLLLHDPVVVRHASPINGTLVCPRSETLVELRREVLDENHTAKKEDQFKNLSIQFFKRLALTLIAETVHYRVKNVHKIARQKIEGFNHLIQKHLGTVVDVHLSETNIMEVLLLILFKKCFWQNFICHILTATKSVADNYLQKIPKLSAVLQIIFDPN